MDVCFFSVFASYGYTNDTRGSPDLTYYGAANCSPGHSTLLLLMSKAQCELARETSRLS